MPSTISVAWHVTHAVILKITASNDLLHYFSTGVAILFVMRCSQHSFHVSCRTYVQIRVCGFSEIRKTTCGFFLQIFNKIFYFQVNLCDLGFQKNFTRLPRLSDSWFKFEMENSAFPERLLASLTLWNSTLFLTLTRSLWKIHYFFNILGNIRLLRKTFHFLQIIPAFSQLLFVTSFKKRFPFLEIVSYNCIEPSWYDTT